MLVSTQIVAAIRHQPNKTLYTTPSRMTPPSRPSVADLSFEMIADLIAAPRIVWEGGVTRQGLLRGPPMDECRR